VLASPDFDDFALLFVARRLLRRWLMATLSHPARRAVRHDVVGPSPRTYESACEEFGGRPWGEMPDILKPGLARDSALIIKKGMSERTMLLLLGGSALFVIVLCIISLVKSSRHVAESTPVAVLTYALAAPTPAPPQPMYAMAKSTPSVQSLFSGSSHRNHKRRARQHRN
jgi:hypothetical protein